MNAISELYQKTEDGFRQIEQERCAAQNAWCKILTTIDCSLSGNDPSDLLNLIPYIMEGDGRMAYRHIGKTHRILHMLKIIALENGHHMNLFSNDCDSAEALWEKYMLTLFAFRRLRFRLSEESVSEAVIYLQNRPVSYFAAYMISQDELLIPDPVLYQTLALIYEGVWSQTDRQQFIALSSQGGTHESE